MNKGRRAILSMGFLCTSVAALAGKRGQACHPLFGPLTFETLKSDWTRGDDIRFLTGFPLSMIQPVYVPQIVGMPRSSPGAVNTGTLLFHSAAHAQLKTAFTQIEQQGLLPKMISFGGANFQPRLRKPFNSRGEAILSRSPSNHSFGIAFDVNARDKKLGATARPFVEIFEANGFLWGGNFNDPMHFEVKNFIGSQQPAVSCPPSV